MNNWLQQQCNMRPDAPALRCGDRRWTYRDLARRAAALACHLADYGVEPGSRVGVYLANGPAMAVLIHAIMWRGATMVMVNRGLVCEEVLWQLDDCRADLLVTDAEGITGADLPILQISEACWEGSDLLCSPLGYGQDDVLTIMYTSGTTGRPKPVPLTFQNHLSSALASLFNLGRREHDDWLCVLPLFHIGGLAILLRSVIYGTAFTLSGRFDAAEAARLISGGGVTLASLVPTMLHRLLEVAEPPNPGSLRAVLLGGAPAAPSLVTRALRAGFPILQTYGMTEGCSQLTTMPLDSPSAKIGSAGLPLMQSKLEIRDDEGLALSANESGHIWVSGPMVTTGYLDRPAANAQRFRAGWFDTGDFGALDDDGYLWVQSRRRDLIISGGENIYPREIEDVLSRHPGVVDAVVVGVPDPVWGESVAVGLQRRSPVGPEDLEAFCREHLAAFKVPRLWRFFEQIPRNHTGKVLRDEVREAFSGAHRSRNLASDADEDPHR